MNENGRERAEQLRPEGCKDYHEVAMKDREGIVADVPEALEREHAERQRCRSLVEQVHRDAIELVRAQPLPPYESPTVHFADLPAASPDSQFGQEWNFYRREVGSLLANGHEGRFVLIKGEKILGIWDTQEEAEAVAFHHLLEPHLIHQIHAVSEYYVDHQDFGDAEVSLPDPSRRPARRCHGRPPRSDDLLSSHIRAADHSASPAARLDRYRHRCDSSQCDAPSAPRDSPQLSKDHTNRERPSERADGRGQFRHY